MGCSIIDVALDDEAISITNDDDFILFGIGVRDILDLLAHVVIRIVVVTAVHVLVLVPSTSSEVEHLLPLLIGENDVACDSLGKVDTVLTGSITAHKAFRADFIATLTPLGGYIVTDRYGVELGGISLVLAQDVGELAVHRVEVVLVHRLLVGSIHLVHIEQGDFHATLTQAIDRLTSS